MANEINIETLRDYYQRDMVVFSNHAIVRMEQRNITQDDIESCLMSGEIIEQYPDDYPNPSCLIYGVSNDIIIHVVMGDSGTFATVITAYKPDTNTFLEDLKTRKRNKK